MKDLIVENVFETLAQSTVDVLNVERHRINWGCCFIWTDAAHTLYPDSQIVTAKGHCFLRMDGKYYDSDVPQGGELQDLFYKYGEEIYEDDIQYYTTSKSLEFWRENGNDNGRHLWALDAVEKIIDQTLNVLIYS